MLSDDQSSESDVSISIPNWLNKLQANFYQAAKKIIPGTTCMMNILLM
jgi:hypothetical protein